MEAISVFDIFKIGVGPSSSHTMGPWRAAERFLKVIRAAGGLEHVLHLRVRLMGSLAKTGKGHGTDLAVMLGLSGEDPVTCDIPGLRARVASIRQTKTIRLGGAHDLSFDPTRDILFDMDVVPEFHANGLTFIAAMSDGRTLEETYYSVGGGFIVQQNGGLDDRRTVLLPFPALDAGHVLAQAQAEHLTLPEIVRANERVWRSDEEIDAGLLRIWQVMQDCIYRGCHTSGTLPGGLSVTRRAARINHRMLHNTGQMAHEAPTDALLGEAVPVLTDSNLAEWKQRVRQEARTFEEILTWVSTFALAVNEENAAFGRVVTAPTNGAAGVIPAVMMYYELFRAPHAVRERQRDIINFMLVAAEIGSLFKKGATISAAMGGCQAEIGVSSAMAAAGLAQCLGASPAQVMMAAEIAMEHHLGLTCDPIGGLVQVPCIERNTMGAIKAITAATIAMESDPALAKVSLDSVIRTMWSTAKDMNSKYKETAEGGLALQISVVVSEC